MDVNNKLDCTGLFCPMPLIKTKNEIDKMKSGEIIEILADDPGFENDLISWCKITGDKFLEIKKEDDMLKGYVQKK